MNKRGDECEANLPETRHLLPHSTPRSDSFYPSITRSSGVKKPQAISSGKGLFGKVVLKRIDDRLRTVLHLKLS